MFDADKILILSPHADDEVLSCGGLIGIAKEQKKEVFVNYYSPVLLGINDSVKQVDGNVTQNEFRYKEIEKVVGVPVIDGVVSALMMVESLNRYGVSTSKAGKYS